MDDLRVESIRPLLPPAIVIEEVPAEGDSHERVSQSRQEAARIIGGTDPRLVVVVGPCSVHDPKAALEYAGHLKGAAERFRDSLLIIMRTYFEKPRTTVGWKGLINDPYLDESYQINRGLTIARTLVRDVVATGLPAGLEYLDPLTPQYMADLISWGAIGARTTESQVHRQMASGLSMPVGFKNGTSGTKHSIQIAIDAVRSAAHPHRFLGMTKQGVCAIVATTGNPHCHLILRGGIDGPNYDEQQVKQVISRVEQAGLLPRLMVDCSHGNSEKDYKRQPVVAEHLAKQVRDGQTGIAGVMLESFLVEGNQKSRPGDALVYGQSITDGCMDFPTTEKVLQELDRAVRSARF